METRKLRGKAVADAMKSEAAEEIRDLKSRGVTPGLAVLLVGENPASAIYVRNKTQTCVQLGMQSERIQLSGKTTTRDLLQVIGRLNRADEIDGILVQLPLPAHIDEDAVLQAVHPAKDVDGLNASNLGKLFLGRQQLAPCTPTGILELLRREGVELKGAHAVVVGRSNIVGKPLALLLLQQHCTVTICHSRTRGLADVCRKADLLVAAVGRPALVTREFIQEGAVVVDVGINRIETREEVVRLFGEDSARLKSFAARGSVLVGDVHPRDPFGVASAVTPVPGGVGPLTIAQLMKNTVLACRLRRDRSARRQPSSVGPTETE